MTSVDQPTNSTTSLSFIDAAADPYISETALAAFNNLSIGLRLQILEFYNETRTFERKVGIIIPSIFTVVIAVGLVGNLLVIVVALNRQMRNSTNMLIIGLTCSDLMFLTLCVPFTAIDYAFPVWVLPTWTCNMINYLQHTSAYFSVWTLTLMAADRFLAVCYPVESMTLRSSTNTLIALLITYGIIMLSQIQVGRIHDVYNYTFVIESRSACSIVSIARGEATVTEARLYFFSFNIFGYVIPLGITCIFYYFMLKRLWYMPKPGGGGGESITTTGSGGSAGTLTGSTKTNVTKVSSSSLRCRPETIRAKRKVTRLVMCVVVIWAICWLPLNICFFISGLIYPDTLVLRGGKFVIIVQISSQVLAYTNSCLNPILYPLVSENFRKGFLRIIFLILNWCSFGRLCRNNYRNFRLNSRMEVTFYNGGSRSRSSTTTNRMSRTNSSSQHHRHNTSSTTNTHALGESSSLLIRSSFCSNTGTVVATVPTLAVTATVAAGNGADGILSTTAATGTLLAAGGSRTSLAAENQHCGGRGLMTNCATLPLKLQYHYYHEQQQVQHRRNSTRAIENNAAASSVSLPLLLSASSASAPNGFGTRARSPTVGIGRRCGSGSATSDRLLMSRRSDTIDENASDDEDSDADNRKIDGDTEALTERRRTTCGSDAAAIAEKRRSTRRTATVLRRRRIVMIQRRGRSDSEEDDDDAAAEETREDDTTQEAEDAANDENV